MFRAPSGYAIDSPCESVTLTKQDNTATVKKTLVKENKEEEKKEEEKEEEDTEGEEEADQEAGNVEGI